MEVAAPIARAWRASTLSTVALSALVLFGLRAHAGDGAAPQAGASQPSASQPAVAQPAASHPAVAQPAPPPADVAAQKVLRVATSGDYAPFSFAAAGAASGTDSVSALDGLDVEIAKLFAKDRGYRIEIVRFRWPDLAKELAAGSFDVAMSGVTVRPERSIAGRLSVPVAATQAVVLTWMGSGMTSLPELDRPGRRVAVNAGGHLERVAHQLLRRADVLPIADNAAVGMSLLDRTVDAVVTDNFEEKVWTRAAPDAVRIGTLSDDRKAYLLPASRADLAAELDRWLLAREADGTLAALRKRYIRNRDGSEVDSDAELQATAEPVAALVAAIRERLALMPLVYEAKKAAGNPIEDRSQEAAVLDGAVRAVREEAAATGIAAPDPEAVRALFAVLIELGKDSQQKIADAEARRRPASVRQPLPEDDAEKAAKQDDPGAQATGAAAESAATESAATESAAAASTAAGSTAGAAAGSANSSAEATAPEPRRHTGPDLATELRPAIGRIGEKIARIVVAMKDRVTARTVRKQLEVALSGLGLRGERLDELAGAIARVSAAKSPVVN